MCEACEKFYVEILKKGSLGVWTVVKNGVIGCKICTTKGGHYTLFLCIFDRDCRSYLRLNVEMSYTMHSVIDVSLP